MPDVEIKPQRYRDQRADLILDRIRAQHDELVRCGHRGSRRAARTHAVA